MPTLGILLLKCAHRPPLLTEQAVADAGAVPPTKATFFFFFTARLNASDLLSDVAWMIQTKQMPLSLKIEVERLNICT